MFASRKGESGGPKLAVLVVSCNISSRLQSSTLIKKTDGASKQKATLGEEAKRDLMKQELARSQSSSLTPAALLPSLNAIC